jgi:hypothetical protein
MFKGRSLLIATKHKKEEVIAPIFERELGVKCFVSADFDTDELGTFSGEIERKFDPITTARKKCLMAMDLANCDLAVSSEGSFGPHPTMFFAPAGDEFLIFIDKKNDLEIFARELSTETNFYGAEIRNETELREFAEQVKFPSHGLIIKKVKDDFTDIVKSITSCENLESVFNDFASKYGKAYIETDMRAMYNPTRMSVIESATWKLTKKIKTCCPNCGTPGFSVTDSFQGLPCGDCNFPTRSTLSFIHSCQKCSFTKTENHPNGKHSEDPMYCDVCNP